jgi:hypothetical protein
VIESILILRISKISKYIFGIAGKLLEVEELVEPQLFYKPFLIFFGYLNLNLMVEIKISLFVFLILVYFLGVGKHGAWDGHHILNGVPS